MLRAPGLAAALLLLSPLTGHPIASGQDAGQHLELTGVPYNWTPYGVDAGGGRVVTAWSRAGGGTSTRVWVQSWSTLPGTGLLRLDAEFEGPAVLPVATRAGEDRVAVGPDGSLLVSVAPNTVHAYAPGPNGSWQSQDLTPQSGSYYAFGREIAVDLDARRLAVLSSFHQGLFAVALYELPLGSTSWQPTQIVTYPTATSTTSDYLSLALDGDLLYVGYRESGVGHVAAYQRDTTGQFVAIHDVPPTSSVVDRFGHELGADNGHLLVGSRRNSNGGLLSAYAFDGSGWTTVQQVNLPSWQSWDRYGESIDVDGDHAMIGAFGAATSTAALGVADVLSFNGTSWQRRTTMRDGTPAAQSQLASAFGTHVAVDTASAPPRVLATGLRGLGAPAGLPYPFAWAQHVEPGLPLDLPVLVTAGTPYCPQPPNSSGASGVLRCTGTADLSLAPVFGFDFDARGLPPHSFALLALFDHVEAQPIGPFGVLCSSGPGVWRVTAPALTDATGAWQDSLAPLALPTGPGTVTTPATVGSTWAFQILGRDGGAVVGTNALAVTFR